MRSLLLSSVFIFVAGTTSASFAAPGSIQRPPPRPRIQHLCGHKVDQFRVDSITCNANQAWGQGVQIEVHKNDVDIVNVEVHFADGGRERLYRLEGRYRAGERIYDYFRSGRVVNVTVGGTSPNVFGKSKLEIYLLQ